MEEEPQSSTLEVKQLALLICKAFYNPNFAERSIARQQLYPYEQNIKKYITLLISIIVSPDAESNLPLFYIVPSNPSTY